MRHGKGLSVRAISWMIVFSLLIVFAHGQAGASVAYLTDNYFYDADSGLVWFDDLNQINASAMNPELASNLDWGLQDQMYIDGDAILDDLSWRVATTVEINDAVYNTWNSFDLSFNFTESTDIFFVGLHSVGWYEGVFIDELSSEFNSATLRMDSISGSGGEEAKWVASALNMDYAVVAEVGFGEGQPVPEPTTMLLFGTGLLGLAGFSRRRFKK